MLEGKNRYPGIRSFEPDDQRLFYGRSKEIEQLYNLIKIKPLVVLFGKSGLGKTSLLKAGVGPLLIEQDYYPVMIRLQDIGVPPSTSVLNALEPFVDADLLKKYGNKSKNKIWEALNAASFKTTDGRTATPLLIFDQFEELFSHNKEVQEEFAAFLGDLTENRVPADIESALNEIPRNERSKELMAWFQPPNVKIVFAIRSDRISELHSLRFDIPAILQNRYELKPLHARMAREAIEKPATLSGTEYLTQPFSYAPETIEKIQAELSNDLGEIESFQLQIICQYIERKVRKLQAEGKQHIEVTPDFLGGEEGIRGILKNYYNNQISMLGTDEEQMAARILLEEGLIINERRIGVAEAVVKESFQINDELLEKLLTSRLIRPEDTRLGRTYEISHDTLVKPILEAYEKRRIQEERLAAIDEQNQKRKEEEKERVQKERKLKIVRLTTVIFLLSGFAIFSGWNWWEADKAIFNLKMVRDTLENARDSLVHKQNALQSANQALTDTINKMDETISAFGYFTKKTPDQVQDEIKKIARKRSNNIDNLFSNTENVRRRARQDLEKEYKTDHTMVAAVLEALNSKGTDYFIQEHADNIGQILYLFSQCSKEALSKNKNNVEAFTNIAQETVATGEQSKSQINTIRAKLK